MRKVEAIFGPPGTGKTRTLVDLAGDVYAHGHGPAIFLSYTRAAAAEAVSRFGPEWGRASTLHSLAFNAMGMSRAVVVDSKKLAMFAKETGIPFKGSEFGSDELQEGDEYMAVLQFANNRIMNVNDAYERFGKPGTLPRFQMFVGSYYAWKRTYGYMDFDDMLMSFLKSDMEFPYRCVFLDEAQDCSPLQWAVFRKVVAGAERVWIAGDDDQAIYEWNGADPHGMVDFVKETSGTTRVLDQSYRVPIEAFDMAHKLVGQITKRQEKKYKPRNDPGTVEQYGDMLNFNLEDFNRKGGGMILVRDRFRLEELKKAMNRDLIPYEVLGAHSPWASKVANELRKGGNPEIPFFWREFYRQADLSLPINVTLSTIHQAKGREAPRVAIDLTMPARALLDLHFNRDAELRVWYVALTRVSKELYLCGDNPLI